MTLTDAFHIYTRKLHRATLRPFLGWRVVNAANTNTHALLSTPLSRMEPQEAGFHSLGLASCFCSIPSHDAHNTGFAS